MRISKFSLILSLNCDVADLEFSFKEIKDCVCVCVKIYKENEINRKISYRVSK